MSAPRNPASSRKPRAPRGMGCVRKVENNGKTVWRAIKSVTFQGTRKYITGSSPDRSLAIARMNANWDRWRVRQNLADAGIIDSLTAGIPTYGEFLTRWQNKRLADPELSPNTKQRYRGFIKNHIRPALGNKLVNTITEKDITKALQLWEDSGLGSSARQKIFYLLRESLRDAQHQQYLSRNPAEAIRIPKNVPKKDKSRLGERLPDGIRIRTLLKFGHPTDPDAPELITSDPEKLDERYCLWMFVFYGLRQSERLGLEWDSLHQLDKPNEAYVRVDRQLYYNEPAGTLSIEHHTKTPAGVREIPISEDDREVLVRHWERQQRLYAIREPGKQWRNLVFTNFYRNPIRQSTDRKMWNELCAEAGVSNLDEHDMRHITATLLGERGAPEQIAISILGHGSKAMTTYYTHISLRAKRPVIEGMAEDQQQAVESLWDDLDTPAWMERLAKHPEERDYPPPSADQTI